MKYRSKTLCSTAVMLLSCAAPHAAVLFSTQMATFNFGPADAKRIEIGSADGSFSVSVFSLTPAFALSSLLNFNQFDTSLGTLTDVTLSVLNPSGSDILTMGASIAGDVGGGESGTSGSSGTQVAKGSALRSLSGTFGAISNTNPLTTAPCSELFVDCPGVTSTAGALSAVFTNATGLTPLANFIGGGTIGITAGLSFSAPTLEYSLPPDCASTFATLNSSWGGTVNLRYTYTTADPPPTGNVPEPGSLYLAGMALAGLVVWRQRRAA